VPRSRTLTWSSKESVLVKSHDRGIQAKTHSLAFYRPEQEHTSVFLPNSHLGPLSSARAMHLPQRALHFDHVLSDPIKTANSDQL
jgi:hypothetical protein